MSGKSYEDIIHLPCPTSRTHPRMPLSDRAAQFAPFSALTGYDDAIDETGRRTEERLELNEEMRETLDRKMRLLSELPDAKPQIVVTYFLPDARKAGGSYQTVSGNLKRIDAYERVLIFADGQKIPIGDIYVIEGECFHGKME